MNTVRLPNGWNPRDYQVSPFVYLQEGGKRLVAVCHRRWGKDDLALHSTATKLMQKPATYWHMLPKSTQARKAIWQAINPHTGKKRIDEAFPKEIRKRTNDNETITIIWLVLLLMVLFSLSGVFVIRLLGLSWNLFLSKIVVGRSLFTRAVVRIMATRS